jgi:hypothetical protein
VETGPDLLLCLDVGEAAGEQCACGGVEPAVVGIGVEDLDALGLTHVADITAADLRAQVAALPAVTSG